MATSKNMCFPEKCRAMIYCDKYQNIPFQFKGKVRDLHKTVLCSYKEAYHNYLESEEWLLIRDNVLKRADFKCQKCDNTESLHVHHLNYSNVFKESNNDLIVLCNNCHKAQHKI